MLSCGRYRRDETQSVKSCLNISPSNRIGKMGFAMLFQSLNSDSNGVGFVDTSNLLKSGLTANTPWTATEDCWVCQVGIISATSTYYIDDVAVGYSAPNSVGSFPIPLKNGQTVKSAANNTQIRIYGTK